MLQTGLPQALIEALEYYVYRLVDPHSGETFYVGKGQAERALQHAQDALIASSPGDRLGRIRAIRAGGHEVGIVIHRHGMDAATALAVEAALIDVYPNLTNLVRGHGSELGAASLEELVERYAAPNAIIPVPAILIKIEQFWHPGLSPTQLYERTRRYWKCNPERRRPTPSHALAVARGIVREVYRIEGWDVYSSWPVDRDPSRDDKGETWPEGHIRRGFRGAPDPSLGTLRGASVRGKLPPGAQNPIAYVNC